MTYQERIRNYLTEACFEGNAPDEFEDDYDLIENEILDSLTAMNLITFIEENFGIDFEEEDITPENLGSVNMICTFLDSRT